jgi:primosomal protein N' (replication factor Y)
MAQASLPLLPETEAAAPPVAAKAARRRRPGVAAPAEAAAGQVFARVAEVAVAGYLDPLSYGLPPALQDVLCAGHRVTVPLRGQLEVGVVTAVMAAAACTVDPARLRPVLACLDPDRPLTADLMDTIAFLGRYYHAPLGMAVRTAVPAALRRTGIGDDKQATRTQPWVAATWLRPWPDDLSRTEIRLLHRIEGEGSMPLADLRRKGEAPMAMLKGLADRGLLRLWHERVLRDPLGLREAVPRDSAPALHGEQAAAVAAMVADLDQRRYGAHLLHGVTGSGKTEVYLHVIAAALEQGRGALVLIPEIALTPQLVQRFRARFGDQVAALHSAMSEGERLDAFERIQAGERRIVIGPRSALFAPLPGLGVIVVDECHDPSFKQHAGLRYHARDVALVRARAAAAVCVLGSATPGCEEMALAQAGRLQVLPLRQRAVALSLPAVTTVDLREAERLTDAESPDRPSLLTAQLVEAVRETVQRGEQAILLHNRRGFATSMICRGCGSAVECPECAISLTWHRASGRLRCHGCDLSLADAISCPACGSRNLLGVGAGTERIEGTLAAAIPGLRIARFDRDTAVGQRLLDTLQRFRQGQLDVLVGTQMLAKGHDFPAVTLVGVVLAEASLRIPDFRAAERTFQLLTQVAGRAGRGSKPGRVLVQTYQPSHFAVAAALQQDHATFSAHEMQVRQQAGYPPFVHVALLEARHADPELARASLKQAVEALRQQGADVRGPVLAAVARLRNIWRVHALVRHGDRTTLHRQLAWLRAHVLPQLPSAVEISLDVDPQGFS